MKPEIKVLLDRREEIRKTINKLEAEYGAIEKILLKLHQYEEKEKNPPDYSREDWR